MFWFFRRVCSYKLHNRTGMLRSFSEWNYTLRLLDIPCFLGAPLRYIRRLRSAMSNRIQADFRLQSLAQEKWVIYFNFIVYKCFGFRHTRTHTEEKFFLRWAYTNLQSLSDAQFFVFWYICWEMSTQRQFDLCMGPDTKETDCTQNTLHFYVKFIRRDRHITSIKNLRPKVACSLSRGLPWNDMHSQIWTSRRQLTFLGKLNIVQLKEQFSGLTFPIKEVNGL